MTPPDVPPPERRGPTVIAVISPVGPVATLVILPNSSRVIVSILVLSPVEPYVPFPGPVADKFRFNVTSPSVPPPPN